MLERTPETWHVEKLSELAEIVSGENYPSSDYIDTGVALYRISNIGQLDDGENTKYLPKEYVEKSSTNRVLSEGDITIAMSGATTGKLDKVKKGFSPSLLNQRVGKIIPDSINKEFLYHYLNSEEFQNMVSTSATGAAQDNIGKTDLRRFRLPVPPRDEQERIASVLYTVDSKVEVLNERYDNLTRLKQALMQDLLTGQTRFSNKEHPTEEWVEKSTKAVDESLSQHIPKSWEQARLANLTQGSLYGLNESALSGNDEDRVKFIRVTNLKSKTSGMNKEMKYVEKDKVGDKKLEKNDVLFARSGSVGKTYLVNEENTMSYGGYMIRYRLDIDKINPRFLLQYTKSPMYWDWITRVARGGVQQNISTKEYDELLVPLPPKEEQEKIASVLYTVDEMIAKTDQLIDKYEDLKRGLMQDLLSGDVRTPEDLEVLEEINI